MFKDDEAQEIVPGLYLGLQTYFEKRSNFFLGPYASAQSKSRLEELKIEKILTMGVGLTPCFPKASCQLSKKSNCKQEYEYMWIQIEDIIEADLLSHLPSCLKFISGNTL